MGFTIGVIGWSNLLKNSWFKSSIPAYTKNQLVSWFDDKELSSGADAIGWNSLKKNI